MANLYLTEQNSILRKTGDRLIVMKEDQVLLKVQCHKIDAVLIFGNVQFTTQVVHELFEHGIEMAILTRSGRLIGQITSPMTKNITLRIDQFRRYMDDEFRARIARAIVTGKIRNSLNHIRLFSYNHPEVVLRAEMKALDGLIAKIPEVDTLESLLGHEGTGSRIYFQGLGKMVLGDLSFQGRSRRPPRDPVNSLLSFTYTLIFNEIASLLDGLGLDPYLGYFHKPEYGRASLASDLIEEFRAPVGDRFTLDLVNRRILNGEHFYTNPKGGVYLKREGMKRYFVEYEKFLARELTHPETGSRTTLRRSFRTQAEVLIASIRGEREYRPFRLEL